MSLSPLGVGVIGAGVISHAYLRTICCAEELRLVSITSKGQKTAAAQAARYGGEVSTLDTMLADPGIDVIVNLAPPDLHHSIGRKVIEAGKHLYSEKPLATSLADASDLLALARSRGLALACAADTFLGPAHQAARRLVDAGAIGSVVGAAAVMASNGMEHWHPNPAFFYDRGGGPLLDIGPYLVTQLVNLLGPVEAVTAIGTRPRRTRTVSSPGRSGETIEVKVPTTVNGVLLFVSGANVALTVSWDVVHHTRPAIELYGLQGSLITPTPNGFDGDVVRVDKAGARTLEHRAAPMAAPVVASLAEAMVALTAGTDPMTGGPLGPQSPPLFGDLRGLGLVDMARAVQGGGEPRASGQLAYHVLDVLLALQSCAEIGDSQTISSTVPRPAA